MIFLADVIMAPVFLINPIYGLVLLTLPISIEVAVLMWQQWGTWRRALSDSVLVNVVSTVVGFGIMSMLPNNSGDFLETLTSLDRWGHLLFLGLCSVVIEGIVLKLRYWKTAKTVWKAALFMNIASYVLLSPLFMFFLSTSMPRM
jgi:hypothetical protein